MTNAYDKLPGRPDPTDLVVEVPAFEDDRPQPEPAPPAAAPELVAATEFARSSHAPPTIRRTQMRAGAWIAGVPIAALVIVAIVQILLPRRPRAPLGGALGRVLTCSATPHAQPTA
ncbi:hypothetical protein [Curtobacterium flaccumfaciens]|uniref:hypothetical protein n=1 Tax=Curtobacterium flaccumfaciens TaxID=2035 RepID=UPI001E5A8C5F|nr:hypothetical protein [Curtobacterium allii]MCE0459269.1 hypothetical protein [Curtobacterium allii]